MGNWLLTSMLISLLTTILLEEVFAVAARIRNRHDLLLLCLVNLLTNPVVVLGYYLVDYYTYCNLIFVTFLLETMAILVEAYYFKVYGKTFRRPLLFSVCVNIFSYGVGKIIFYWL